MDFVHLIVWKFRPEAGKEAEFEAAYGPRGTWAALFARGSAGYLGTELARAEDGSYLTVDRWASRAAYEAFRARSEEEYAALDRACEALTASETPLGTFDTIDA